MASVPPMLLAYMRNFIAVTTGKTTFFVANQAKTEPMAPEKVATLEAECKAIGDENKLLAAELKKHSSGADLDSRVRSTQPDF